jgi:hypothetical protein
LAYSWPVNPRAVACFLVGVAIAAGNEAQAGPEDAVIEWFDDAGMSESCGPSSCDARCPSGTVCSIAFITHALLTSGTCP